MFAMMRESRKLPIHVKAWMGVMAATFGAHFLFLNSPLHVTSLTTFIITLSIFAPLSFKITNNINALAATHFVAWPIALAYGLQQTFVVGSPSYGAFADSVLYAGYAVFFISLLLDYRILLSELSISAQTKSTQNGSIITSKEITK